MEPSDRLDINLTPLLDLVLQLVMFFMLTVSFVKVDRGSDAVDLPVAQSAMPLKNSDDNLIYINIGASGERQVGSIKLENAAQFREYLQGRRDEIDRLARAHGLTGPTNIVVVVRAHKDVACGVVWDTLADCQRAGIRSWQLRVIKQPA